MSASRSIVNANDFARFYAPLAATSLLLTATTPILIAALARSAEATITLAGYGVAFAVCGVLYAPLLVVQQVAAARLLGGGSFLPVKKFAYLTGIVFSLIGVLLAYTVVGEWVFAGVVAVSTEVMGEAVHAMQFLWPVPFLTAVRAAHQGRLVAGHRTRPIAYATGGRTIVLAVVALGLAAAFDGAWVGGAAFTAGLLLETLIVLWSPTPAVKLERGEREVDSENVAAFSAPLMVNVLLWWATPLIINGVLARTVSPDQSLAAFAVVEGVAWFIVAPVGQMQHASIALVECSETHKRVRRWGVTLALAVTTVLVFLSLPLVREPLLRTFFELEPVLVEMAGAALVLTVAYPVLYGLRQYYQGLFVRSGRTMVVGAGAMLRVASIFGGAFLLYGFGTQGAVLGVGLAVLGLVVEVLFLERYSQRDVMPELRARRAAAVNPEVFEGAT